MKKNHDIELLKIGYPYNLSLPKSLKKFILDGPFIDRMSTTIANATNINSLTLMYDAVYPRSSVFIRNMHITRYAFINVIFEEWNYNEIAIFLSALVLNNEIIDTLIFRGCSYSVEFLRLLLYDVADTYAPLQTLELALTDSMIGEFAQMIFMTNTIHVLIVNEMTYDYRNDDLSILEAFRENMSIMTFEYPPDGLLYNERIKDQIRECIEYNINRRISDVFRRPLPDISRFISQRELLGRYLEEEKKLKKERFLPIARLEKEEC